MHSRDMQKIRDQADLHCKVAKHEQEVCACGMRNRCHRARHTGHVKPVNVRLFLYHVPGVEAAPAASEIEADSIGPRLDRVADQPAVRLGVKVAPLCSFTLHLSITDR